jgi:polar amino acid transport system permease protein
MAADDHSSDAAPDRRSLEELPVRSLTHWGRPALAVIVVLVILGVVDLMAHADIDYSFVPTFFTSGVMLDGALRTIELAVVAQATAIVLGGIIAAMRVSHNPVASWVAAFYTWLFRAIPALVQLLLWFNLALVVKTLEIPIPFTHLFLFQEDTNKIITIFTAAWIALALNESAYMSEIIRAGLIGVDHGQQEAAHALGMTPGQAARRVTIPQALRTIVPPTSNDFINMIKETSLASVISYVELTEAANNVSSADLQIIPALFAASAWYIILVTAATGLQQFAEKKVGRGAGDQRGSQGRFLTGLRSALNPLPVLSR